MYLRCSKNPGSHPNSQIHPRYVRAKTVQKNGRQSYDSQRHSPQTQAHYTSSSRQIFAFAAAVSASAAMRILHSHFVLRLQQLYHCFIRSASCPEARLAPIALITRASSRFTLFIIMQPLRVLFDLSCILSGQTKILRMLS